MSLLRKLLFSPWTPVLVYILLATAYSLLVPVFEAPDEPAHIAYLNQLLTSDGLPMHAHTAQAHQPPAYYALLAAGLHRSSHDGLALQIAPNPGFRWTGPARNLFLHPPYPLFSLDPQSVFLHQLRALQLILGAIPVLVAWKLARMVIPEDAAVAWMAAMLAATLPQFLFISASVSNGNLSNALSAVALYWMIRLCREERAAFGQVAVCGALIGLSLLAKLTAAFLLPAWIVACLLAPARRRDRVLRAAIGTAAALLVSGWFYVWNVIRFGNLVGERVIFDWAGVPRVFQFGYWYFLFRSFWGRFGWLNVKAPAAVYVFFLLLSGLALFGLVRAWRRRPPSRELLAGSAAVLFLLLSVPLFSLGYDAFLQPQGRYLFPALSVIAMLMALGLRSALQGARTESLWPWSVPAATIVANILILAFSIYPAYYGLTVLP